MEHVVGSMRRRVTIKHQNHVPVVAHCSLLSTEDDATGRCKLQTVSCNPELNHARASPLIVTMSQVNLMGGDAQQAAAIGLPVT